MNSSLPQFSVNSLSHNERAAMIKCGAWAEGSPFSLDRLKRVDISYVDFDGNAKHDGALVVADVAADAVAGVFRALYEEKFPIKSIKPIHLYDGNDDASMEDNNSSAFNFRKIAHTDLLSIHSYGLAIDVNPEQNPYGIIGSTDNHVVEIFPKNGKNYLNRTNLRHGMVEPIVNIFRERGFSTWGGDWNDMLDWHHFQTARPVAELLAEMTYEHGKKLFDYTVSHAEYMANATREETDDAIRRYKNDPEKFVSEFA